MPILMHLMGLRFVPTKTFAMLESVFIRKHAIISSLQGTVRSAIIYAYNFGFPIITLIPFVREKESPTGGI